MGFLDDLFSARKLPDRRTAEINATLAKVDSPVNGAPPAMPITPSPEPALGQNSLSTMPSVPAGMTLAQFQAQQAAEQQKKMEIAKAMAAMQAQGGSPGAVAQPMPQAPQKPLRVPYNVPR